jgi:hypothetical protein
MTTDQELRQKRGIVGLLAIACITSAMILLSISDNQGFASALLRVGSLLGAFWLALPTEGRPAAWAQVSPLSVGLLAISAALIARLKFFIPLLLVGFAIGWLVRPRSKNHD